MMPTTFDEVNGKRVRVARMGDADAPALVFLHGYPDNLQIWCELAPRLADAFRVVAFDWPGLGHSDPWPGGATPSHIAARLLVLFDAWGIRRASLVGLDMGGQPALAFAALHPDRVERLVVMNSLVQHDAPTSWEIRILRKFGWNRVILRRLPWLVFRRAVRSFLPAGAPLPEELRRDLWEGFHRPEVRDFLAKMCAGYQGTLPKLAELYPQIKCPTLALWAGGDRHFPPVHAERLCAAIPGAQMRVVAGALHWMAWSRPEEIAGRVRDFLTASSDQRFGTL